MTDRFSFESVQSILLDIEGTVAPVEFVYGTLFPFARQQLHSFMAKHQSEPEVMADCALLWQEYQAETAQERPDWSDSKSIESAIAYVEYLMDCDRKSTGLKSLQGKIWDQGYQSGELKSQLFEEVPAFFEQVIQSGKSIYIYSSGSVQAQILIFKFSEFGDLTPQISGYFDTQVGAKKESSSYQTISEKIGDKPEDILFISDVEAELDAAQTSRMQTLLSVRPGNQEILAPRFRVIHSLNEIF